MEGRGMYNTKVLIDAYITYARDVAVALGADPQLAYSDMYEMVRFEREISKVILFCNFIKANVMRSVYFRLTL